MWETLIKVTYEDFVLDDDDKLYYQYLVRNFESCLADNVANIFENSFSGQVPGTKEQSNSETWLQEHCFCITASVCKNVVLIGEHVASKLREKIQKATELFDLSPPDEDSILDSHTESPKILVDFITSIVYVTSKISDRKTLINSISQDLMYSFSNGTIRTKHAYLGLCLKRNSK